MTYLTDLPSSEPTSSTEGSDDMMEDALPSLASATVRPFATLLFEDGARRNASRPDNKSARGCFSGVPGRDVGAGADWREVWVSQRPSAVLSSDIERERNACSV